MPYVVKKSGDKFCVFKKGASKPVPNGCYPTQKAANKRRDAMNINVKGSTVQSRQVVVEPIDGTDGLLSVVRNVEMCAVGIEYPLASGPKTFTPEDLLQAVASQDDPAIQSPRVWLGHPDDQRFNAGRTTPAGSAEPALGKAVNLRVEDEGMTLVGDIMGCPTWLANILASAYPSRSIEGFADATTVTGHHWDLVITDLALLGVTWPGVSTLEDLQALYSEEGPDGIEVKEEDLTIAARAAHVTAQAELEKIRRAFVAALPDLQIPGWPWIRAILQDPNELIVDDDEGGLYRLPYSASGGDVEFGELKAVKIQYVNAQQRSDPHSRTLLANMLTDGHTVAASWDTRAASRPDNDPGGHSMTPEELRANLGLPADATDEQVKTRLQELQAAADSPSGGTPSPDQAGDGGTKGPGSPPAAATATGTTGLEPQSTVTTPGSTQGEPSPDQKGESGAKGPGPVAGSAALPDGMVAVPATEWAAMQSNVQAIAASHSQEREKNDVKVVDEALQAGKIFPHQRDQYIARVKDANTREAFLHLLTASVDQGGLAPNLVPIEARGINPGDDAIQADAYPAAWLPEVAARKQRDAVVTQEG